MPLFQKKNTDIYKVGCEVAPPPPSSMLGRFSEAVVFSLAPALLVNIEDGGRAGGGWWRN